MPEESGISDLCQNMVFLSDVEKMAPVSDEFWEKIVGEIEIFLLLFLVGLFRSAVSPRIALKIRKFKNFEAFEKNLKKGVDKSCISSI